MNKEVKSKMVIFTYSPGEISKVNCQGILLQDMGAWDKTLGERYVLFTTEPAFPVFRNTLQNNTRNTGLFKKRSNQQINEVEVYTHFLKEGESWTINFQLVVEWEETEAEQSNDQSYLSLFVFLPKFETLFTTTFKCKRNNIIIQYKRKNNYIFLKTAVDRKHRKC